MLPFRPESSTLPSGFRFHYDERPKTPEPPAATPQPPPPRQPRKLKRRNVLRYSFEPPADDQIETSADVPLPTIEIPEFMEQSPDNFTYVPTAGFLAPAYRNSPPKTPIPQLYTDMTEHDSKRPDWSMVSSPDERPCSALSNPSEYSDESYFSSIRTSRASEDGLSSPEGELMDPHVLPLEKGKQVLPLLNSESRNKSRRDAHWTKDMSAHLWQTYQIYLSDSTVTPFRVGASGVPPEGVVVRVAREAKRSWRGPKQSKKAVVQAKIASSAIDTSLSGIDLSVRSGSNTPTAESFPNNFPAWPHSSAATRNHLRELCKKDSSSVHKHRHLQSRSPTPFTHFRARSEGHAARRSSAFSIKDFALSLTTSTSDSMRPDGPLAQLSASQPVESVQPVQPVQPAQPITPRPFSFDGYGEDPFVDKGSQSDTRSRRLGSPFLARSYGPSSSQALASFGRPSPPKKTNSGPPRLRSPVRFDQSRSLNNTGKRRAPNPLEDEIRPITRPSILDDQLFGGSLESNKRRVRNRGFSLGDEALSGSLPPSFSMPQMPLHAPHDSHSPFNTVLPTLLPSATFASPADREDRNLSFTDSGNSATFPRRFLQPAFEISGSARFTGRPYNTVHHPRRSIESFDFGNGPSLESRLAELDGRLAEIKRREDAKRAG